MANGVKNWGDNSIKISGVALTNSDVTIKSKGVSLHITEQHISKAWLYFRLDGFEKQAIGTIAYENWKYSTPLHIIPLKITNCLDCCQICPVSAHFWTTRDMLRLKSEQKQDKLYCNICGLGILYNSESCIVEFLYIVAVCGMIPEYLCPSPYYITVRLVLQSSP